MDVLVLLSLSKERIWNFLKMLCCLWPPSSAISDSAGTGGVSLFPGQRRPLLEECGNETCGDGEGNGELLVNGKFGFTLIHVDAALLIVLVSL